MKKRKILVLFPLLGLLLSGCTFQEGLTTTKNWISDHIVQPIKNLFNKNKSSGGNDSGKDDGSSGKQDGGGKTDPGTAQHAGTMSDPFTGADANAIAAALQDGAYSSQEYYVKGVVQEAAFGGEEYGNFDITIEDGFKGYRMKNGATKANFSDGDIVQGDIVLMYGKIKNFKGTYELDGTKDGGAYVVSVERPAPTDAELASISIEGTVKTEYLVGEKFGHEGLSVTAHYADQKTQNVTSLVEWSYSQEAAVKGQTSVTITASYKGKSDSLNVQISVADGHAGTEDDPLTGAEANAIGSGVAAGSYTTDSYYIRGVVKEATYGTDQYHNYNFKIEDDFVGFRMKNGANKENFNDGDIQVGYIVTMYGRIKNQNGSYELEGTQNGGAYVVSIITEVVDVASVNLAQGEDTLNLELGKTGETLHATVLPENATNKAVQWSSDNGAVATVTQEGYVEPKGVGDTYIRVTSKADSTKEAVCHVYVTQSQATLVSIEITGSPDKTSYYIGEEFDPTGFVVTAHYSDGDAQLITSFVTENWTTDPAVAADGVTSVVFTVSYNQQTDSETVQVSVSAKPTPSHAGTSADPYTISDCEIVYADANLAQGKDIGKEIYVAGTILADPAATISGGRGRLYIGDSSSQNSLYIYNINNIGGSANLTLADIPAGSEVVAKGTLKNYNGMQLCFVSNVADCEFITINKPFVAPTTVEITSGSELGVGSTMNLAATVGPEGASQSVEWTILEGGNYATLSNGVLTGTAEGDVTIKVNATGYADVSAQKIIHVSATVTPTEQVIYTLSSVSTGGNSAPHNSYKEAAESTQEGVTWSVLGNSNMAPWRLGGKEITDTDRTIASTGALTSDDVTKVIVTTGTKNITLNSVKLFVGNSQGAKDVDEIVISSGTLVSTELTFERPAGHSWAGKYFTIAYNVTNSSTSNQYAQFVSAEFYAVK